MSKKDKGVSVDERLILDKMEEISLAINDRAFTVFEFTQIMRIYLQLDEALDELRCVYN